MKYKIFLLIVLFCYIYPIYLKFFPIPTDRIIQIVGFLFLLINSIFRKKVLTNKHLLYTYFISLIFLVLIYLVQNWNYTEIDWYFFKYHLDIFLNFFSAYLIVFLLYKIDKNNIFENLLDSIVLVSFIQAIISLIFFFVPSIFEMYTSLLSENSNQGLISRLSQIDKRLMGVGSAFFSGVIKYSIPFFIAIILPKLNTKLYQNTKLYFACILLITIAGVMTGRTFFIAIFLGIALYLSFSFKNFFKLIFKIFPTVILIFISIYFISFSFIDQEKLDRVYNFVFEIFINYQESGEISSRSTEGTLSMYKFPTNNKTWLIGDGRMLMDNGSYYMKSDVGYVRLIFYFGIVLTILYFIYQFSIYLILMKSSKRKFLKYFFLMLFIWLLILNFKGLATFNNYLILFLLVISINKNFILKKNDTQ
ncbi:O-antigen polymerase [Empedobacter brevis]|uniref:O-antigen polymerase n=1 Tax=Empedobacter brevis TaxID=247 RepID=UPI002FDF780B